MRVIKIKEDNQVVENSYTIEKVDFQTAVKKLQTAREVQLFINEGPESAISSCGLGSHSFDRVVPTPYGIRLLLSNQVELLIKESNFASLKESGNYFEITFYGKSKESRIVLYCR